MSVLTLGNSTSIESPPVADPPVRAAPAKPARVRPVDEGRIEGVDAIRMFAALGAAWLHTSESPELAATGEFGRFAVPVFNTIAAYFLVRSIRRHPEREYGEYARTRVRKLYIPFLAWGVIYVIARELKAWYFGIPMKPVYVGVLLEGPSHQLWYLPFVLICGLIGYPLARWALESRGRRWGVAIACFVPALVLSFLPQPDWSRLAPWGLDYFANRVFARSPSFLFGFTVAMLVGQSGSAWDVVQVGRSHRRKYIAAACFVCGLLLVTLGVNAQAIEDALGSPVPIRSFCYTLAGLLFVASAFGDWRNPVTTLLSRMRHYAFGVFLSHTLFIEGMQAATGHIPALDNKWYTDIGIYVLTIIFSVALTAFLHASRRTRWLIPN